MIPLILFCMEKDISPLRCFSPKKILNQFHVFTDFSPLFLFTFTLSTLNIILIVFRPSDSKKNTMMENTFREEMVCNPSLPLELGMPTLSTIVKVNKSTLDFPKEQRIFPLGNNLPFSIAVS